MPVGVTGDVDNPDDGLTYVYVAAQNSSDDTPVMVDRTYGGDDDSPASHFATAGTDDDGHGVLYAMDDNDTYIEGGDTADPCETIRPAAEDNVRVISTTKTLTSPASST